MPPPNFPSVCMHLKTSLAKKKEFLGYTLQRIKLYKYFFDCLKNHFCIQSVDADVNFDKLVHENRFYSIMTAFRRSVQSWED